MLETILVLGFNLISSYTVMAESAEGTAVDSMERTADYSKLIDYGLNEKVAIKLDQIYQQGKLKHEASNLLG